MKKGLLRSWAKTPSSVLKFPEAICCASCCFGDSGGPPSREELLLAWTGCTCVEAALPSMQ